ncbi:hypothetical protein NM688_g4332 [Phlebia brevispora]|uniref:Uncharacterized protein n=1 Tax=Phlebia brevispora TaxID=194682 RepID=A0ACC1T3L6_9APHY|nr:hypothetical protein NM688_g4332 [Phlebia brevispora]
MATALDEHEREPATSSLDDYLKSPIATLLESVEDESLERVSRCDMIQAYSLLSARIKNLSSALKNDDERTKAVQYLTENASKIFECLTRDIQRTFNPFNLTAERSEGSPSSPDETLLQDKLSGVRENSALAQHALVLVAEISAVPECSSLLNDDSATDILSSIVSLIITPCIPTPGEKKIRSLAIWALSCLRFSAATFEEHGIELLKSLASLVSDTEENELIVGDAFKVLHNLLVQHPIQCLPKSLDFLAPVLRCLIAPAVFLRKRAAYVLIGYAHALLAHKEAVSESVLPVRDILSTRIGEFVESQASLHRKATIPHAADQEAPTQTLIGLIHAEIPQDGKSRPGPNVGWAFAVLHALVVLSDGQVFMRPDFVRFVAKAVHPCFTNEWAPLHSLHAGVWRALVWAYTRIAHLDDSEDARRNRPTPMHERSLRDAVFETVKQLPDHNVGSSLVYTLMGPKPAPTASEADADPASLQAAEDDVSRAMTVLRELICSEQRNQRVEGIILLTICTTTYEDTDQPKSIFPQWDPQNVLSETMWNLDVVDDDQECVKRLTQRMTDFPSGAVRPFSDGELVKYWSCLVDIWDEAVREGLQVDSRKTLRPMGRLMRSWQGLIRAQAKSSASQYHKKVAERIGKVIVAYLDWKPCCARIRGSFGGCITTTRLQAIHQLVRSAKDVLSPEFMELVAPVVLDAITDVDIKLENMELKALWIDVCSFLCAHGGASCFLQQGDLKVKRKKWTHLAELWLAEEHPKPQGSVLPFIAVPFSWVMTQVESTCCVDLFECIVKGMKKNDPRRNKTLERLCGYIQDPSPIFTSQVLLILINYFTLNENDIFPTKFVARVNDYLCKYPPLHNDLYHGQEIVRIISGILLKCSNKSSMHIVPLLKQINAGVCKWLVDDYRRTDKQQFQDIFIPFYCNAVSALRSIPFEVEDLRFFDDLLAAPFARREDERAYHALGTYWAKIEDEWRQRTGGANPPPGVEKWVSKYHYAYKTKRPFFLDDSSASSQSDASMATVPDSQPPIEDEPADNQGQEGNDNATPTPESRPEIASPKTPVPTRSSRDNRHGPLTTSPLLNKAQPSRPQQIAREPSILGKRQATDPGKAYYLLHEFTYAHTICVEPTNPRQRKRTATSKKAAKAA